MKAAVLAGGVGSRMRELTENQPKALVTRPDGRPLIEWTIGWLHAAGVSSVHVLAGYKSARLEQYLVTRYPGTGRDQLLDGRPEVSVSDGGVAIGTGARLVHARHQLNETFVLTYCDLDHDIDLAAMCQYHRQKRRPVTMALVNPISVHGEALLDRFGDVSQFVEKPLRSTSLVNAGVFIIEPRAIPTDRQARDLSWERDVLPDLALRHELAGWVHEGAWKSLNTPEDLATLAQVNK